MTACLALSLSPRTAWAEYHLDSGDVLEISVFGVPGQTKRTTVNVDGNISVPLIGDVHAAGESLSALNAKLKELAASNEAARGTDVSIEVVQYRPFFISGDVSKAGAYPYQPEMTVRQAVALAGGPDPARFNIDRLLAASAEMRGQYESLWIDLTKQQARVLSLRAELAGQSEIDPHVLYEAPISLNALSEIARLEADRLRTRQRDYQGERDYLQRVIRFAGDQVASLEQEQIQDKQGAANQAEELARVTDLNHKGLVPVTRVIDAQRAAVLLNSRQMETGARLARASQEREELVRKLAKAEADRQLTLTQELQNALLEIEKVRAQLQATQQKMVLTGVTRPELAGSGRSKADIAIYRKVNGGQTRLDATDDTKVEPGDVVELVASYPLWMSPSSGERRASSP